MKIAIPLKTNKEDSAITPVFGKAKWFAFIENGEMIIERNEARDGIGVIEWLLKSKVTTLITKHMSQPPYQMVKDTGQITIYYAGDEKLSTKELIQKCENNDLIEINVSNEDDLIKSHQKQNKNK